MDTGLTGWLPGRYRAGLSLAGLLFLYWSAVSGPLFAVAVASLVVAGERASAVGRVTGSVRPGAVPLVVAVELGVALLTAIRGEPGLGATAGGLFLLAAWLAGATPRSTAARPSDAETGRERARRRRPGD